MFGNATFPTLGIYGVSAAGVVTSYATPELAQTGESSGATIFVNVSATITSALGKNGVHWCFGEGVTITRASGPVWEGTSLTFDVTGEGRFVASSGVCVSMTTPGRVNIKGRDFTGTGASNACVYMTTGSGTGVYELRMEWTGLLRSVSYDPFWIDGDGAGTARFFFKGAYQRGSGSPFEFGLEGFTNTKIDGYAEVESIEAVSHAPIVNAQGSTGHFTLKAGKIMDRITADEASILLYSTSSNFQLTVECPYIKARHVTFGATPTVIRNAHFDSTTYPDATVDIDHDGTIFENVTITTDSGETNSITGTAGKTLTVVGDLTYNKAVSNVTLGSSDEIAKVMKIVQANAKR
jgi:hypothetical protein